MSKHISIAVGATELRGLWLQSGTLRWHARSTLPDARGLEDSLRTLLASSPRVLRGARVTLVLSPRWVQTKQLHGLPAMQSARLTAQLLQENEQAFFLWSGCPSTVVVEQTHDGCAWGAALDTEFLGALVRAVRSARLRIVEIVPSVAAIAAAFPAQAIGWSDGAQSYEIQGSRAGIAELRRVLGGRPPQTAAIPDVLSPIGGDAPSFLPAYAAAVAGHRLPLAWRPRADPARLLRRRRFAQALACVALVGAGTAAAVAPAVRATTSTRDADRELRRLRVVQQDLVATQSELRRVSEVLDRVARFVVDRGRITRTVGALSEAMPESTAILDLRLDSVEGSFSAYAPSVTDVLPALADVGDIAEPRIVGSVTRETVAGVRLERAAFRFRRAHARRERGR
jgi:hypothetical protein